MTGPATRANNAIGPFIGSNSKMLWVVGDARDVQSAVYKAILDAENDKLEQAALALLADIDGSGNDPYEACLLRSAAMIRALKKD